MHRGLFCILLNILDLYTCEHDMFTEPSQNQTVPARRKGCFRLKKKIRCLDIGSG